MKSFYKFITVKSPMDEFLFNKITGIVLYIGLTILAVDIGIDNMLEYGLLVGVLSFLPIYAIACIFAFKSFFQK